MQIRTLRYISCPLIVCEKEKVILAGRGLSLASYHLQTSHSLSVCPWFLTWQKSHKAHHAGHSKRLFSVEDELQVSRGKSIRIRYLVIKIIHHLEHTKTENSRTNPKHFKNYLANSSMSELYSYLKVLFCLCCGSAAECSQPCQPLPW